MNARFHSWRWLSGRGGSASQLSSDVNRERIIYCFSRMMTKFLLNNYCELFLQVLNSINLKHLPKRCHAYYFFCFKWYLWFPLVLMSSIFLFRCVFGYWCLNDAAAWHILCMLRLSLLDRLLAVFALTVIAQMACNAGASSEHEGLVSCCSMQYW